MPDSANPLAQSGTMPPRLLIVDDEPSQRRLLKATLASPRYQVTEAENGIAALEALRNQSFDAVLLDKRMPEMDGHAVLRHLREEMGERMLPVIMVTAYGDSGDDLSEALHVGATDFIRKPYDPLELIARVDAAVSHKRLTDQLENAESILFAQARLAEARDRHTGNHVVRVARNAVVFGQRLGLSSEELVVLRRGAVLHDIGKLAIPDNILLKPGKLNLDEWEIMMSHTVIGERLVSGLKSMRPAAAIIRSHHERWNGTGYPDCLAGEEIPLLVRIFQLADIYDALAHERPYKHALSPQSIISILEEEVARGWRDPELTAAFLDIVRHRPQDLEPPPSEREDLGLAIFSDIIRTGALPWTGDLKQ